MYEKARQTHWYLTSPHIRRAPGVAREVPFGTAHVKLLGAAFTACGQPASNWPVLWGTRLDEPEDFCPDCQWSARSEPTGGRTSTNR